MKLINQFKEFLNDVVNLNDTRINLLDDSVEAIKKFIRDSDWKPKLIEFIEHGSWAHGTIIKPLEGRPFDADLVVFVELVDDWAAKDYVDELGKVFRASGTYKDKIRVWDYCVTVEYAQERKIDIAPCIVGRAAPDSLEVCNRKSDKFEDTNPKEYTRWVKAKNAVIGNHGLRKATRLLKYIRDIKGTFTCPSFLLTTLIGLQISDTDAGSQDFVDTPTAFRTLLCRLDDWLLARPNIPYVPNPALPAENQGDAWTADQYTNFRNRIHSYRTWSDDAYLEPDQDESVKKWRRVFGDEFGVLTEAKKSIAKVDVSLESYGALLAVRDAVDLVRKFGIGSIDHNLANPPHMKKPHWKALESLHPIHIKAELAFSSTRLKKGRVSSADILLPDHWIDFTAINVDGSSIPQGYTTWWRITNNGPVAQGKGQLRGDFYCSKNDHSRAEHLQYRGVHLVEAFVIRDRDEVLVARSAPFFVVIE